MPIKGEQQGYTYKVLIDGVWQEVTIQESPLELEKWFEQNEEWTRVRHGHWIKDDTGAEYCSNCHEYPYDDGEYHIANWHSNYCPNCGCVMDEVEDV